MVTRGASSFVSNSRVNFLQFNIFPYFQIAKNIDGHN